MARFEEILFLNGASAAGWSTAQLRDAVAGAVEAGYRSRLLAFEAMEDRIYLARAFDSGPLPLVVDANCRLRIKPGVAKLSLMLDHPLARLEDLQLADPTAILGWVDESHVPAARALGIGYRMGFLPHAGPPPLPDPPRMAARDIDLFFAGDLDEPIDEARWRVLNPAAPEAITRLIFSTMEAIRGRNLPLLDALAETAPACGIDIATPEALSGLAGVAGVIQSMVETNYRVALLAALPPTVKIVVAAMRFPSVLRDRPNLIYLRYIDDFQAIQSLMRRSRIVLNATLKFPHGAHERIWYGMAAGAAVLTDPSTYVAGDFRDGQSILFLPPGGEVAEAAARVAALVPRVARLEAIAQAARAPYEARHTWRSRIEEIVRLVG